MTHVLRALTRVSDVLRKLLVLVPLSLIIFGEQSAVAETISLVRENGVLVLPVQVNGAITLNFTLDSGASDVVIPQDVFSTLSRAGTIGPRDMLDAGTYVLADGSRHEARRFRIRTLRVGGIEVENVVAGIAPSGGTLLLGQSFLSRLPRWSIDNRRAQFVIDDTANKSELPDSSANAAQSETYKTRVKRWLACAEPFTSKIEASSKYEDQLAVQFPRYGLLWSQWSALTSRCATKLNDGIPECSADSLKTARSELLDKIRDAAEPDAIRGFSLAEAVIQKSWREMDQKCGSVPQQ